MEMSQVCDQVELNSRTISMKFEIEANDTGYVNSKVLMAQTIIP